MLVKKVEENLKPFLKKGQTIIVGLSGGSDSVVLTHILNKLKKRTKYNLIAAHLNHMLRGKESNDDEKFIQKWTQKMGIHLIKKHKDIKKLSKLKKQNLEETARRERYHFFEEIRKKTKSDWIAVAHNQNDNLETVMMNILRGCALNGLQGMSVKKNHILRPLINIPKKEITSYIKKHKLSFQEDRSNQNIKFKRNYLRLVIIPELKKIDPKIEKNFEKFIQKTKEAYEYLNKKIEDWLNQNAEKKTNEASNIWHMKIENYSKEAIFFQKEILRYLYENFHGSTQNLSSAKIDEIRNLIIRKKTGEKKDFGNIMVNIIYNEATFSKIANVVSSRNLLKSEQKCFSKILTKMPKTFAKKSTLFLDYEKTGKKVWIRSWQNGDRMIPLGMKKSKKLQDIFTDKKIPQKKRNSIGVVVNDKDIVGLEIGIVSEKYKVDKNSKKILKLTFS